MIGELSDSIFLILFEVITLIVWVDFFEDISSHGVVVKETMNESSIEIFSAFTAFFSDAVMYLVPINH